LSAVEEAAGSIAGVPLALSGDHLVLCHAPVGAQEKGIGLRCDGRVRSCLDCSSLSIGGYRSEDHHHRGDVCGCPQSQSPIGCHPPTLAIQSPYVKVKETDAPDDSCMRRVITVSELPAEDGIGIRIGTNWTCCFFA
jgi:hypothetical protein